VKAREDARVELARAGLSITLASDDTDDLEQAALDYARAYDWTSPIECETMRRTVVELREQLKLARALLELHEREVPLAVRRKLLEALDPTDHTARIEALAKLELKP
jgi:hypothetical protein